MHPQQSPRDVVSITLFVFLGLSRIVKTASHGCAKVTSCGPSAPPIRFPFYMKDVGDQIQGTQQECPSYQSVGFGVECNGSDRTIINLPYSGDFLVVNISYVDQTITLNDPDDCLARRFVHGFSIEGSPFKSILDFKYTFLHCSFDQTRYPHLPRTCLSGPNATVVATRYDSFVEAMSMRCWNITSVYIPFQLSSADSDVYELTSDLRANVLLSWDSPDCRSCELAGGRCSPKKGSHQEVECSEDDTSRTTKYGIMIGLGIPGLVCITGMTIIIIARINSQRRAPRPRRIEITNLNPSPSPAAYSIGLDEPTIESYPKTLLGESKRLPLPNQNTCPICLSEYQPKDELRTIPDCGHYFHARCIDEWLRLNATCPWCRNSPLNPL
ncbi:hypothetical protein MLD38_010841 [Melastoma candidum]|uniref:Uncharacterized protein n=1 Tax=Melastoma candidum TaxID=119954 RepID=A0ACB9R9H1_9MYRT|nr:hypothetical protein MLD38_010841 [Melastoma candidum]